MLEPRIHEFPGGVYSADGETRSDFSIEETNPLHGDPYPVALDLQIVSGQAVYSIVEMTPDKVEAIGKWLIGVAQESREAYRKLQEDWS